MAKTYRLSSGARLINSVFRLMTRLGLGASYRYVVTVPGRKTGRLYSTPVDVIEDGGTAGWLGLRAVVLGAEYTGCWPGHA